MHHHNSSSGEQGEETAVRYSETGPGDGSYRRQFMLWWCCVVLSAAAAVGALPRKVVEMYSDTWFPERLISDKWDSSRFNILLNWKGRGDVGVDGQNIGTHARTHAHAHARTHTAYRLCFAEWSKETCRHIMIFIEDWMVLYSMYCWSVIWYAFEINKTCNNKQIKDNNR